MASSAGITKSLTLLLVAPWRRWYVFFPVLISVPCTFFAWRALAVDGSASADAIDEVWIWVSCTGVALCLATFLAWVFEAFDPRLSSKDDVERTLGWSVLAEIPYDKCVAVTGQDPGRSAPESRTPYEHVADRVVRMSEEYELRSFAITSTREGEGKTSVAIHLAAVLSRRGYRVILVDTCFNNPTIHRHFGLGDENGLSDLLAAIDIDRECPGSGFALHEERFSRALLSTDLNGLQLISAGNSPTVSPKYSEKESFQPFVHQMRRNADFVIFDTPAVSSQSTVLSCTTSVDGCLFVVEAGRTTRADARGAREQLKTDRASVVGVLFNHTDRRTSWIEQDTEDRRRTNVDRSPPHLRKEVSQT